MAKNDEATSGWSRKEFLNLFATGAMAAATARGAPASALARATRPLNILFIVTDQERARLPAALPLPGHDRLKARATVFDNHFVHTAPCGPSRSTIYTGQHTQHTGVYLNPNSAPYPELPPEIPTIGHMLRQAGYRTAYKGKWHLTNEDRRYDARVHDYPNDADYLEKYGFSQFNFDGDKTGLTWEGFQRDEATAADAAAFLYDQAQADVGAGADAKPWFLAVNFVNPHDIMWFDATGRQEQTRVAPNFVSPLMGAPGHPIYRKDWKQPLPRSFHADDLSTKPMAHRAELASMVFLYGELPRSDVAAWERFQNYYFNCVIDMDRQLVLLLDALERSGQADNTIIIYTSDHGERAGAHGMRQKGSTVYDEDLRVPLYIAHPDVAGGRTVPNLASTVDLAPTILSMAGVSADRIRSQWSALRGVDLSPVLHQNATRTERDSRGILFNYAVGYGWNAPDVPAGTEKSKPLPKPDFTLRRLHRGVFDGRYKFARYFAPADHHLPRDWATLTARNDLELYDLATDPDELVNLATMPHAHRATMLRLNAMTNALIETEIGEDRGKEYRGPYPLPAKKKRAPTPPADRSQRLGDRRAQPLSEIGNAFIAPTKLDAI